MIKIVMTKRSRFRDFIKATAVKTYKSKMPATTTHGDASTANSNEFRKRMKKLDKKLMVVRKTNQAQKCINEFSEIVRQYGTAILFGWQNVIEWFVNCLKAEFHLGFTLIVSDLMFGI